MEVVFAYFPPPNPRRRGTVLCLYSLLIVHPLILRRVGEDSAGGYDPSDGLSIRWVVEVHRLLEEVDICLTLTPAAGDSALLVFLAY